MTFIICPECNQDNAPTAKGCASCGYPLQPSQSEVRQTTSERTKQLTQNPKQVTTQGVMRQPMQLTQDRERQTIPETTSKNQTRLHTGFLSSLKLLQALGFIGLGFWAFVALVMYQAGGNALFWILLISVCLSIYTTTESLIAVIDLLSRIEQNTRNRN
jgi:hypothetical protein